MTIEYKKDETGSQIYKMKKNYYFLYEIKKFNTRSTNDYYCGMLNYFCFFTL